jgi:hypothetical protein
MAFLNYENPLNRRTPSTTMPTLSGGVMKPLMTPTDPAKNPIVDPSNALTEGVGVPPTTTGGIDPAGPQTEGVMTPDTGTDNFLLRSYMASGGSNPALRDQLAQTMAGSGAGPTSGAVGLDTSAPVSTYTGGGPYGGINPTEAPPTGKTGMPSQPHVDTYNQQAPTSAPASDEDAFYADLRNKQAQWQSQDAQRYGTADVTSPDAPGAAPGAPGAPQAPGAPGAASGNPGVSIGGQQAWAGGPMVATSRVSADGLPSIDTDFAGAAQRGADAAYQSSTKYFDEDFAREKASNDAQLQAQGFQPGTEAYNKQMELMQRTQDSARTKAAADAQQVGFNQAGDLLQRALASRAQMMGERNSDADRTFAQSLGIANLGLGSRGQDAGVNSAALGAAASSNNAQTAANSQQYSTDVNANLALQRLGLDSNNQNFSQLMQLIAGARGGVNVPNFGAPTPLNVGDAYSIASNNSNNAANRTASNNNALYNLGGNLLGQYLGSYF